MLLGKLYTFHYDLHFTSGILLSTVLPQFLFAILPPPVLSLQLLGSKVLFSHQDPPLIRRHSEKPSNYSVIDLRRSPHTNQNHPFVHYQKSPRLFRKFSFPEESSTSSPAVASSRQTNNADLSSDSDVNRWKHETVVRSLFHSFTLIFLFSGFICVSSYH